MTEKLLTGTLNLNTTNQIWTIGKHENDKMHVYQLIPSYVAWSIAQYAIDILKVVTVH